MLHFAYDLKKSPHNGLESTSNPLELPIHYIINKQCLAFRYLPCISKITMGTYFETWMEWRENETSVSKKTIKENRFMWTSLLKDQDITLIPLNLIIYFRNITKSRQITRKRFNDLKSIMNEILYLAVENDIIERNCLRDINYKQFRYKAENTKITP